MTHDSFKKVFGSRLSIPQSWSSHIEGFGTWLGERGYTELTVKQTLQYLVGPTRTLEALGISVTDLDEIRIDLALKRHPRPVTSSRRRALHLLLEYLRDRTVVSERPVSEDPSAAARLERRYVRYLEGERALAEATVLNYRGFIRDFLVERFEKGPAPVNDLSPRDVTAFLLKHVRSMSPKRAQLMGCSLRSFLRFLFLEGESDRDLSFAVPTVRQYQKSTTPRYLVAADVERILASCDRTTSVGRRNRAILLLLARLGLRAGEVVKLELEDLRWRTGALVIRGKGGVQDRLPLPADVGEALTTYLTRDRISCSSRRVFLRMRAPRRGFSSAAAVTTVVEDAIARSGLRPPHRGAHLLRHSLATGMIRRGATMAEIGQLLRHRSMATTEVYAKVDFEGLREVSLPFPGTRGGR